MQHQSIETLQYFSKAASVDGSDDNDSFREERQEDPFLGSEDEGGFEHQQVDAWDDQLHTIRTGLFLGSMNAEANLDALRAKGVTHILQVGEGLRQSHPGKFMYKQIYVDDDEREDLVAHFPNCFDFIEDAQGSPGTEFFQHGGVLVHCAAGCSRSATVCLGYLMWKEKIGFHDAWKVVHAARPWVCPNDGFKRQLFELEKLECDLSKWRAWRHVEAQQELLQRQLSPSKMVLNKRNFCSLEVRQ
mmetsp:Transcript_5654/g.15833  ORF Transcript_5654/g.15833 Transcript_5654/m.15833 type:complete len:245 (+) Transcript_5654:1180-1914(+)|eukprot:CAMPEP_0117678698 /NCGR_PEP_ID=MMETSP0804-20121206/17433_1 /TAXON_ID=1074897 /ORGANISM="Tetraselmis astigmatica, Strain CCMP880" /LENGTH=244 /DNA_ID=CAMNT_0005488097 /DNA_START=1122 /DNA_END=1856 /DNA_ORIENTATION=-